jgi:ATP-binding cassette subfamily B protein/ATP-binding cassette subfamily C protein
LGAIVIIRRVQTRIKRHRRASRHATEQVTGIISEIFSAVQAIKVAGAERPILKHFHQLNQHRYPRMVQDQVLTALLSSVFENIVSLGTGLILILISQSIQAGTLTVGDFTLFVYYLTYVTRFLNTISNSMTLHKQTEVSFERLAKLMEG